MIEPIVLVHGGAGDIPEWRIAPKIDGVQRAAKVGYQILSTGGFVLDAVEAAVKVMEDDEAFNAGRGSVLTVKGSIEMDAIIMEGNTLKTGAVAGISNVSNPISVARLVMETTPHILLTGPGATNFAREKGVPFVNDSELVTPAALDALEEFLHGKGGPTSELGQGENKYGTVGAVAVDHNGHVACATSTGGMTGKLPGRVGDTPLVGCGGYCDDSIGACSATGHGETIARVCLCRHITGLMETGLDPKTATEHALLYMKTRTGGTGGAITISNKGEVGIHFTSKRMAWAYAVKNQVHYGIEQHDDYVSFI